ncbi:MAG: FkbM family methyltransferase [Rhodobacteraceae bacterium]|nr:FkbM family methyltransferase [Paracoccaceae bacterium]
MRDFEIDGIDLTLPDELLSPGVSDALESGRYETLERGALRKRLRRNDRVLDLGAGAGITAVVAARIVGPSRVVAVEPHPALRAVMEETFAANDMTGIAIEDVAVLPARETGSATLYDGAGFWSASLLGEGAEGHEVRGLGLWDLIDLHDPDVILCDLEGFESALFTEPLPTAPRLVIMELHPRKYAARAIQAIFDAMSATGLTYSPHGSRGSVVVFERVEET